MQYLKGLHLGLSRAYRDNIFASHLTLDVCRSSQVSWSPWLIGIPSSSTDPWRGACRRWTWTFSSLVSMSEIKMWFSVIVYRPPSCTLRLLVNTCAGRNSKHFHRPLKRCFRLLFGESKYPFAHYWKNSKAEKEKEPPAYLPLGKCLLSYL